MSGYARLTTDSAERKNLPIATGFLDYFPDAIADCARLSKIGNDKHNPGQPLHWNRPLSSDHADTLMRHFIDRGKVDTDGVRHSTKVLWRAAAILQLELEDAAQSARSGITPGVQSGAPNIWPPMNVREYLREVKRLDGLVTLQAHDDLHTDYDGDFGQGQI